MEFGEYEVDDMLMWLQEIEKFAEEPGLAVAASTRTRVCSKRLSSLFRTCILLRRNSEPKRLASTVLFVMRRANVPKRRCAQSSVASALTLPSTVMTHALQYRIKNCASG